MLIPAMHERVTVVVHYEDIAAAADHVTEIIDKFRPIGLEAIDQQLIEDQRLSHQNTAAIAALPHPDHGAWLLVQFGADEAAASAETARRFTAWLTDECGYDQDRVAVFESEQDGGNSEELWRIREAGLAATAFPPDGKDHWPGWEDSAVPPERCGDYLRDLQALLTRHDLAGAVLRAHRPGLHPRPLQLRPAHRAGDRQLPRVHGGGGRPGASPTAGRCPASTGTGSRKPSCWPSSTGESWWRRCASSSASGTRPGR